MKTPREILFDRHSRMEFKLHAVRHKALDSLKPAHQQTTPTWREWLISLRWQLAGMGAVWLAVLMLRAGSSGDAPKVVAEEKAPPVRALLVALASNRQLLIDLTETPAPNPDAAPPKRSEVQVNMEVV